MADIPLIQLNDRWRIAHDDSLQWILQRREGKGWLGVRYHTERKWLLHSIAEFVCGAQGQRLNDPLAVLRGSDALNDGALSALEALPARFRESLAPVGAQEAQTPPSTGLIRHSTELVAELTPDWRVMHDRRQWLLIRKSTVRRGQWVKVRSHTERTWLLHSIAELVCDLGGQRSADPAAAIRKARCLDATTLAAILAMPERYRDWRATWTLEPYTT